MPSERPSEPWWSFLTDLAAELDEPVDLHCFGGFVMSQYYGLARETADLDVLSVIPRQRALTLESVAGKGSPLHRKHRVSIDRVAIASHPAGYESRLLRIFPFWANLRIWALEAHDLALTKLERSIDRDLRDVIYLAQRGLIHRDTLIQRFQIEMRPYLSGPTPTWHDTTLPMWIEACWPTG